MYQGRYFTRSCINVTGDFMDGDIYPVYQPAGKRRKKCKPTSEVQKRLNQRNAEMQLTREMRLNFGLGDIFLHLTCRPGEEPRTLEEALRLLKNFIRRIKRIYRKLGIELKYLYCIERGGKNGRFHYHMILTGGVDRDTIEKAWGKGYANSERLQFGEDGLAALARYMVKGRLGYKRWSGSRNLVKPEPVVKDNEFNMGDVEDMREAIEEGRAHAYFEALYPGYELIGASCTQNGVNRGWYISFEMRRKRKKDRPGRGGCRDGENL